MATASNRTDTVSPTDRRLRRRQATVDEALEHAVHIMGERGVGGLTVSEVARRMGISGPSLYKYFPSLHAVYDALFARGLDSQLRAVHTAIENRARGVARIRSGALATVTWSVANPALAQLLFWRPVPDFAPSPESFQPSVSDMDDVRTEFAHAVALGELDERAATADAARLFTVVLSGVISQQMANQPGVAYEAGDFTRLTDEAIEMFLAHYRPIGAPHANPGP